MRLIVRVSVSAVTLIIQIEQHTLKLYPLRQNILSQFFPIEINFICVLQYFLLLQNSYFYNSATRLILNISMPQTEDQKQKLNLF